MVAVTVEATWRLSRVELNLSYAVPGLLLGYGEVLLQEAASGAGTEAAFMKPRRPALLDETPGAKTYGSMPTEVVSRPASAEVLAETVTVDGVEVSLEETLATLNLFFEKWRIEDEDKPTGPPIPESASLTPVPVLGELGEPPDNIVVPVTPA